MTSYFQMHENTKDLKSHFTCFSVEAVSRNRSGKDNHQGYKYGCQNLSRALARVVVCQGRCTIVADGFGTGQLRDAFLHVGQIIC